MKSFNRRVFQPSRVGQENLPQSYLIGVPRVPAGCAAGGWLGGGWVKGAPTGTAVMEQALLGGADKQLRSVYLRLRVWKGNTAKAIKLSEEDSMSCYYLNSTA